ncbi:hypothetical protein FPS14_contig00115-0001 [Flavobacterium psychrophilum]|nr:hypothetical protein FPS14_contig00115-0001 [Flavobacterium psychrophilum]
MKLILFFASLFLFINANSQCIFPSGQNQRGVTITLSVDSPGQNLPVF